MEKISDLQNDLLIYFRFKRLIMDKIIIDKKISETTNTNQTGFFSSLKNSFVSFEMNYRNKRDLIYYNLNDFNNKHKQILSPEGALFAVNELFKDDKYGLQKLIFSSVIILDDEYNYVYEDEGLDEASKYLYGNNYELVEN